MSLLPKDTKEFGSKDYWNSFFAGRGTDPFEWYGQYSDLCGLLHTYIRPTDRLLVAGCGNSTLSADLYSLGYHNITNVDVSEVVVRQMRARYQETCPDMVWCHDDLTASSFCSDSFTCVLDKGTLDAIFTDDSPSVLETVDKYLNEVLRLLRLGGRYVCVSLLQEHILQRLLQWTRDSGCIVRFCRCVEAEQSTRKKGKFTLPVFVVVCTKLKPLPGVVPVVESCLTGGDNRQPERVSPDVVQEQVRALQQYSAVTHALLTKVRAGEEARLELCHATSGQLRYVLYILDAALSAAPAIPMGVFIVPQRREVEWLFSSVEGRRQLLESASAGRLVVVHLVRDQLYERGLQQVQDELSSSVMDLAPHDLPKSFKVPFLTAGGDVGSVRRVCAAASSYSGQYVVEDVQADQGATLRRLVFLDNPNVVQSEVRLIHAPAPNNKAQSNNKKKKGKQKEHQGQGSVSPSLDHSYLSCQHHLAMVGGLGLVGERGRGLLLGLGGGPLATYIHQHFPKITLDAVELDEAMVQVAKQYFGFKTSPRLTVTVQDGLDFCEEKANEGAAYDFILLDVDSKDVSVGLSCPPQAFVTPQFLRILDACLRPGGVAVLNMVCRDSQVWKDCVERIKEVFGPLLCQNVPQEVNRLLFCCKSQEETGPISNLMDNFRKSLTLVNKFLKSKSGDQDVIDVDDVIKSTIVL